MNIEPVRTMDGAVVPVPCCDLARDEGGEPVVLPSGERLCCTRRAGHRRYSLHADRDDDGQLIEWP